jgi:hypothetical protein
MENSSVKMSRPEIFTAMLFVALSVWWAILYFGYSGLLEAQNLRWAASYQMLALWGGIFGLLASRPWGGLKSSMGRAIVFFSTGLLLQNFGQSVFSYFNLVSMIEIPYPSLADVGYFGSLVFYVLGAFSLAKVAGVGIRWKNFDGKFQAILIPALMLGFSYYFFLRGYELDWSAPLRMFLDFGYPLGEAIYVSLALMTLLLSRNLLGGIMKRPLVFLMIALVAQYAAEFNFLFQASRMTWLNGGYGDYMYMFSYFLMAISLIKVSASLKIHQAAYSQER